MTRNTIFCYFALKLGMYVNYCSLDLLFHLRKHTVTFIIAVLLFLNWKYDYDVIIIIQAPDQGLCTMLFIPMSLANGSDHLLIHIWWQSIRPITLSDGLTGGNWQKWKRVFLTCPCHKIYRDEAVGLKSCKYTWKNNFLIEARIQKFFCTCVTHIIVIIWSTAHYVST